MGGLLAGAGPAHLARFAFVGGVGFVVDTGCLAILHHGGGLDPFSARVISITAATLTTWRLNRTLTFGASATSQLSEGFRYGAIASAAAVLNYILYAAALLLWPALPPVAAVIAATSVAMGFSYFGYSRFVFQGARSAVSGWPSSQSR